MVIQSAPGTGLGVAAHPDARIDSLNRFAGHLRVGRQQSLHRRHVDVALPECAEETAPATLVLRLKAQAGKRGDRSRPQQLITQRKERITPTTKGGIHINTIVGERGQRSGIQTLYIATSRRLPS